MLIILFGIFAAIALTAVLAFWANADCEWHNILAAIIAGFLGIATAITIIAFCFMVWDWQRSTFKANIINREYGTSYTREEVFYASDVIETIRQLDRKRIELNGNILGNDK